MNTRGKNTRPRCKTCTHFAAGVSECRIRPPGPRGWPSVLEFDFCSQHPGFPAWNDARLVEENERRHRADMEKKHGAGNPARN